MSKSRTLEYAREVEELVKYDECGPGDEGFDADAELAIEELAKETPWSRVTMLSGRSLTEGSDEPCMVGLAISEYAPNGRTLEGLTDTSYYEDTDPWVVELPINCRTVKVCNGTPFQVWNQQRYGPDALLAAVTLELGEDCSFERMLVKYGLLYRQAVPPYGDGFANEFKKLIAKHRAIQGGISRVCDALENDIIDRYIGLPLVTRCRVCCKAVDGGGDVHAKCRVIVGGSCTVERVEPVFYDASVDGPSVHRYSEVIGCLCALPMPKSSVPFMRLSHSPYPSISHAEQLWYPPRCETCGECVFEHWEDAAAYRPSSSRVSRKRAVEQ